MQNVLYMLCITTLIFVRFSRSAVWRGRSKADRAKLKQAATVFCVHPPLLQAKAKRHAVPDMFKFNFDVDELDDTSHASPDPVSENIPPTVTPPPQRPVSVLDVSREHLIGDLVSELAIDTSPPYVSDSNKY